MRRLHLQVLVILDLELGLEIKYRAELERLLEVGFLGHDLRRNHWRERILLERLLGVILDLLLSYVAAHLVAEESFQQWAWRMPGPKALEHDRTHKFIVSAIKLAVDFVGLDLDGHFAPERGGIL